MYGIVPVIVERAELLASDEARLAAATQADVVLAQEDELALHITE